MSNLTDTNQFRSLRDNRSDAREILRHVYRCLQARGYDPITQLTCFIVTGDPTYITSYDNARSMICRIEREDILEELIAFYTSRNFDQ